MLGQTIPSGATWVRFPRFVGDAVMLFPILRLLRWIGVGHIVVYGPRATVGLVEDSELADYAVPESEKPDIFGLSELLRRHEPERAICFPKTLRPPVAAWLAGVPERIGISDGGGAIFNTLHAPFWSLSGPFVTRYWTALAKRWPDLPAPPFADYAPNTTVDKPKNAYICLLPRLGMSKGKPVEHWKNWPCGHFRGVAQRARQSGLDVVVLGTTPEKEMGDAILDGHGRNLCGQTNLRQAAAWLQGAEAVVGGDSGLCHLAAACGAKTIAIFGPTDPTASAPWGPNVTVLKPQNLPCAPCLWRKRGCVMQERECLNGITPEQVWKCLL